MWGVCDVDGVARMPVNRGEIPAHRADVCGAQVSEMVSTITEKVVDAMPLTSRLSRAHDTERGALRPCRSGGVVGYAESDTPLDGAPPCTSPGPRAPAAAPPTYL